MRAGWVLLLLAGCDPYAVWPAPHEVFPWVFTPETDLPAYADVRVETETWVPLEDLEETALYIQKATYHRPSAPYETLTHFGILRPTIPSIVRGDPTLSFVGDVMRFHGNWDHFADGVADRLDGLRVGNLETPVSPLHPTDAAELSAAFGPYAFNSPVALLAGLPLDVLQLNNNHSLDVGDDGLEATVAEVTAAGFAPVGVDENRVLAAVDDLVVGFLSYTWGLNVHDPSTHELFVVPFGHPDEVDLSTIGRDIAAARAEGATHIVLLLHWGYEYEYYPDPHFLQLGRRLVELGADVVVGTGPHSVQPAEICQVNRPLAVPEIGQCSVRSNDEIPRTAAILYSLGNFGTALTTVPLQVGIVATVTLRNGIGVSGLGWEAVAGVPAPGSGTQLVPLADLVDDPVYAAEAARLDVLMGTRWKRAR